MTHVEYLLRLAMYAQHHSWCQKAKGDPLDRPCDCGLDALRKEHARIPDQPGSTQ